MKIGCSVAGMAAGADSIDDLGMLRHDALPGLFGGIRAPLLPRRKCIGLHRYRLPAEHIYGHAKQSGAFGHTKIQGKGLLVRGLNVLAATIRTPLAAPVIASTRLRGG